MPTSVASQRVTDAVATAITALEEEIRCSICLETLTDPHYISDKCRHVFCKGCCIATFENVEHCPLCRAKTSRRACQPDAFMANLVREIVHECRSLRQRNAMELDEPAPAAWRGRAQVSETDSAQYVAHSAHPMQLQEILDIQAEISRSADEIARVNFALGAAAATAAAASPATATDRAEHGHDNAPASASANANACLSSAIRHSAKRRKTRSGGP